MKRYSLLLSIVAIVLVACSGAVQPVGKITSPVMTPAASPLGVPAESPVATPSGPTDMGKVDRIVIQRDGGLAGKSEKWTIYPTGRVVSGDGSEWQVSAEQVEPLFKLVESSAFASLSANYKPTGTCNDCYHYTLTVYGEGGPKTVSFVEGGDLPAPLQQVLAAVNTAVTH